MKTSFSSQCLRLLAVTGVMLMIAATEAAPIAVTNTNDNLAGSLRQAIKDASPGDTIVFRIATTDPGYDSGANIFNVILTSAELVIDKSLTIDGGNSRIAVNRSGAGGIPNFRVFDVTNGVVTLSRLTIAHGKTGGANGGGIYNAATLTISGCLLNANATPTDDFSSPLGGGVYNAAGATLTVSNSTIINNASFSGSGIYNAGTLTLSSTTITGNVSPVGFGAVVNSGTTHVRNSVIALNMAGSNADPDLLGAFVSDGFNFIGVQGANASGFGNAGSHDQVGSPGAPANPKFDQLDDHGGPTWTIAPAVGSPLIDQGNSGGLTNDERGQPRPVDQPDVNDVGAGDASDIGAVEAGLPQPGPTYTVTNISRHLGGVCSDDDCTLAEAINAANANADANIINFAPGVAGLIFASSPTGFPINNPVTINGPGARILTLTGETRTTLSRIFTITGGQQVNISGLSLVVGYANRSSFPDNVGGAILNAGSLTLTDCMLVANMASGPGGAIYNNGADGNATLTLVRCTLAANSASGAGGGILNAGYGGHATVNLTNCTFDQNTAAYGGAIYNDGTSSGNAALTLTNCTLNKNAAGSLAGGIYNDAKNPGSSGIATVILRNTILAAGLSGANLYNDSVGGGSITSQGNNLSSDAAGGDGTTGPNGFLNAGGDKRNTDPKLDILGANSGPTDTCALLSDSPAINAGNDATAPPVDQRRAPRVGTSDIGAFEFGGKPPIPPAVTTSAATNVGITTATLHGTVNPHGLPTTYQFTADFGSFAVHDAGNGTAPVPISVNVTGLSPNTLYYFNVVATNKGGTTHGVERAFITQPAPQTRFETESLAVKTVSGAQHTVINDANLSGGAGTALVNTVTGSFVSYTVPVPAAGTYDVKVRVKTGPQRGKFQLAIAGANRGPVQDEYSSQVKYQLRDLGMVNFASGGNKAFRFTVAGKNPSSGGNTLAFDAIDLIPR